MTKIIFLQPALPPYRYDFFRRVALKCYNSNIYVFYSGTSLAPFTFVCPPNLFLVRVSSFNIFLGFIFQFSPLRLVLSGDILVIGSDVHFISSYVFFFIRHLLFKNTIVWGHFLSGRNLNIYSRLRLFFLRFASGILFYGRGEVVKYLNFNPSFGRPVFSLNNGLDFSLISKLRLEFSPSRKPNIFFIGRLTPKSSFHLLVFSLSYVRTLDVCLHVVGITHHQFVSRYPHFDTNNIVFHGPLVEETDIATVANQCLISVYPGDVGLSIMHSLSYGLPSIIHSSPEYHMPESEIFDSSSMGCNFSRGDVLSLASSIDSLLNSSSLTAQSKCCVNSCVHYNTEVMASNFTRILDLL